MSRQSIRASVMSGPALMTIRSGTLEESQFGLGVFGAEVRDRDSDPGQGEKEIDARLGAQLAA